MKRSATFSESHNDDVTDVKFSPADSSLLFTGSRMYRMMMMMTFRRRTRLCV